MNNFPKCKWLSCLKIINFPKCKCKWLTFLNPKSNPDLFQHFTIFNPILDQRNQRSTIKHAIHLISSSKLLTTKKHDVVSFKSSNFQKKFLRSNFLIRPWFFSHQKVLNVKSFKICRFYCQRLTRANFLSPPIYESVEKKKQKLEMIWRNWTFASCSFLLLSENTSTKSQWRD